MTIETARESVGALVVYRPRNGELQRLEQGVITAVDERYAFVRLVGSEVPQAIMPADLELFA